MGYAIPAWVRTVAGLVAFGWPVLVLAQNTITFRSQVPDTDGVKRDVVFNGQVKGSALNGVVVFGGNKVQIAGTVSPDGSVAGTMVGEDGISVGTFKGAATDAQTWSGTYTTAGRNGTWSAPAQVGVVPTNR